MTKPIIPTLFLNYNNIEDPNLIISYILNHFIKAPGDIYKVFRKDGISFTKLVAEAGGNLEQLRMSIEDTLDTVYARYFPNAQIDITVDFKQLDTSEMGVPPSSPDGQPHPTDFYETTIKVIVTMDNNVYTGDINFRFNI